MKEGKKEEEQEKYKQEEEQRDLKRKTSNLGIPREEENGNEVNMVISSSRLVQSRSRSRLE